MTVPLSVYLPYLLLTLGIEAPLVFALLARRAGWQRALLVALVASLVTHPMLWFLWSRVVSIQRHYVWYSLSGELLVVLVEAGIFFALALRPRRESDSLRSRLGTALGVSLLVNVSSWGTGMLLHYAGLLGPYVRVTARWLDALLGGSR